MKKIYLCFWVCVPSVLIEGCSVEPIAISLSHEPLAMPAQRFNEKLTIENPATDLREEKDRIGRNTTTVFAITAGSITTTSPVGEQMTDQIVDALSTLGYQVLKSTNGSANAYSNEQTLNLKIAINEFLFKNYTWAFPIVVPTWGDIKITIFLENSKGKKLFEKSYQGDGNSLSLAAPNAFSNATKEAMTEILNAVISDFSSQTVRTLITTVKIN